MIPTRPTYHHGDLRNSLIRAALGLVARARRRGLLAARGGAHGRRLGERLLPPFRRPRGAARGRRARGRRHARREDARPPRPRTRATAPSTPCSRFWDYSEAYLHFALEHPAHFRVMHAVPKSEHSREIMLPRSPAVLAQAGMDALVATGVVAPEAAGRALLACWTSVHGLASLAVNGHLPLDRRADARGRARRRAAHRAARRRRRSRRCSRPSTRCPAAPARAWPSSCASPTVAAPSAVGPYAAARDASRPLARRAALHHALGAQAPRLRPAGRARGAGRVPGARAAGAERLQLGAVALRRRHRAGDEGQARGVLRDRLGGLPQGDRRDAPAAAATRRCSTPRSTSPTASTRCR